jgi:hypothetical protein
LEDGVAASDHSPSRDPEAVVYLLSKGTLGKVWHFLGYGRHFDGWIHVF